MLADRKFGNYYPRLSHLEPWLMTRCPARSETRSADNHASIYWIQFMWIIPNQCDCTDLPETRDALVEPVPCRVQ